LKFLIDMPVTPRAVGRLIEAGHQAVLRNKEIARLLNISEKTVKSHLNNIFQKLRLEGRFALALFEQQIQPKT
jgi:DNA-binding CsgD family transcriptional regulator